eukprot:jgi/Phyca11/98711/e_gw1.3.945.1
MAESSSPTSSAFDSSRRHGGHGIFLDENSTKQRKFQPLLAVDSSTSYLLTNSPKNRLHNVKMLRGKLSEVPRHWLWVRFLSNSFFARRLMRSGLQLSAGLAGGMIFNSLFVQPNLQTYEQQNPEEYDECHELVIFSSLIYRSLPAAIVLSLPGSGLRLFEPFKRDYDQDEGSLTGMTKVRRCFIFQLCEVLAVCMLLFDLLLVAYFLRVLFTGSIDSCGSVSSQMFALGGAVCYAGLFVVLYYFARYRE